MRIRTMGDLNYKNPWLGLESYKEGEVLYGRDDDIRDLSQSVLNDTDTLLYGKSGIGKSSILNAGIIPAARRHGFLPVLVRLSHKGKQSYLDQIKDAIANAMLPIPLDESGNQITLSVEERRQREADLGKLMTEAVECKEPAKESLYEFFHRHTFCDAAGERIKLLIIFDQFEEIFTLQTDETSKKRFFAELADFLNDVMPTYLQHEVVPIAEPQKKKTVIGSGNFGNLFNDLNIGAENNLPEYITDNEIHLIFTIREDFLSEFEYYSSAIPSLKQNRYGLRPINEEQAAQIIMRPMPGLIDESVAKLIIEKVTGRTDFDLDGIPEIEVDSAVLSLYLNRLYDAKTSHQITSELVEDKGGEIIADFYSDAISSISESTIEYLEDMLLNGQGRRDNITIFDAINDGGVTEDELDILCNKKKILRQFNYAGDLRIEYVHDILCPVVRAHKDDRLLVRQQEEEKARNEAEREKMLKQQRRERRRFQRTLLWAMGIIVVIASAWLFLSYWNQWEYTEYYHAFTRQNGWPVGVGERMSEQDVSRHAVSYRLVRNGRNPSKPFVRIEVCSPNDKVFLPNFRSPLVGTDEGVDKMAERFASLNMQVRTIRFSGENESTNAGVSRESYYDDKGLLLYGINYYRSINHETLDGSNGISSLWAVYVDQNGLPLKVRDNGADRMKVFLNSAKDRRYDKLEMKYMFYDEQGSPQVNDIGCYGFRVVYNRDLTIDSLYHLDPFSLESLVEARDYKGETTTSKFLSMSTGKMVEHATLHYAMRTDVVDKQGNVTERSYYDKGSNLIADVTKHHAGERCHYDAYNRIDSVSFYDSNHKLVEYRVYTYRGMANVHSEESRYAVADGNRMCRVFLKSHRVVGNITDYIEENRAQRIYRHEHIVTDSIHHLVECSFLDRSGRLTFDSIEQCCRYTNRTMAHETGKICVIKYYGEDGRLYKNARNVHIAAVDSAYYDKDGLKRVQVTFNADGKVLKSMGYDYKDGVEITRYALSLDGHTPIRCPEWEIDGLCYYRLNNVKNAQTGFNLAYIQARSEYEDCASYVYFPNAKDSLDYQFKPNKKHMGENWVRKEQTVITIPPVPSDAHWVEYVHITQLDGEAYKAGLRDGDLVVSEESIGTDERIIRFMRYHRENDMWEQVKPVRLPKRHSGMEIYPVAYTQSEYTKFLEGKKAYEK